ncbi:glycine receptor subunit alphaZ1-like isoform X2 [Acropora millepora]|uniref:glycine receptor subunit alphaZ1-like isoform X2 n=1 Tax=Acropora millepora TaxID=45264 RepID=UPI0010FCA53A|nr:glycine receptor subunit alphaZ1-like isoform X2 [Acropora millepora]
MWTTFLFVMFFMATFFQELPTRSVPGLAERRLRKSANGTDSVRSGNSATRKASPPDGSYAEVSKTINRKLKTYDKNVRPNDTGRPVEVLIEFKLMSFGKIREEDMDYTIDIFFRQWWTDPRLAHGQNKVFNAALDPTKLGTAGIWTPDTYFRNVKSSKYHSVSRENMRLRISKDGSIYFSARITLTAQCDMDLRLFPLDTQECELIIESYAYTVDDVVYNWKNKGPNSIEVFVTELAQYDLLNITTSKKASTNSKGSFDSLKATFALKRRTTYFIFQLFIPSGFVVFLSWLSFWVDRHAVPARISLVITCILSTMFLFQSASSSLPRISYLKAVDYYLITSFAFIVSCMVEYVCVLNVPDKSSALLRSHASLVPPQTPSQGANSMAEIMEQSYHANKDRPNGVAAGISLRKGAFLHENLSASRRKQRPLHHFVEGFPTPTYPPHFIDRHARKIFPLLFGLFNIVYWSYYIPQR